jgi:hypothetical protein
MNPHQQSAARRSPGPMVLALAAALLAALPAFAVAPPPSALAAARFHPLPQAWLTAFNDHKNIAIGEREAEVYSRVLILANRTSADAFKGAVRSDITYTHICDNPEVYRGTVVHIEGKLKRINRHPVPREAAGSGVIDLYEAWIFGEHLGSNPYCVLFTGWPAELPRSLLGKESIPASYRVALDGYFLKKFRYQARDGKKIERSAPLLMGHTLIIIENKNASAIQDQPPRDSLMFGFAGIFGALLMSGMGLTWWFQRTDNRIRRRLLALRAWDFMLPAPGTLLVAAPASRTLWRPGILHLALPLRNTCTAGAVDHRPAPPPERVAGQHGSLDKPPEEGAGARPRP